MSRDFDVIVVGTGLAGACVAAVLTRCAGLTPARVAVVAETLPQLPPAAAPPDLRVVAMSRASQRVLQIGRRLAARADVASVCV